MKRRTKFGAALGGALLATIAAAGPASAEWTYGSIHKVTCGSRTDWLRLWTEYHGYPVCFASNGTWYSSNPLDPNPPKTTWTSYGVCFGNNSGYVIYFAEHSDGRWYQYNEYFPSGHCDNWSATWQRPVEVWEIDITGR